MNCKYIVSEANKLANEYNHDPFAAASGGGALISFKDLGSLKGAFFGALPQPAVVINNSLDEQTQKTVCAHELGHFVLHKNKNFSCENIEFKTRSTVGILEREANLFAAAFLINFEAAKELLKQGYSIQNTAAMLKTDVNLLMFLLNSSGLCDAPDSCFLK